MSDGRDRYHRHWIIAAQTLLGAGLLAAWLWIVDLEAVAETLAQAKWGYVLLAGAVGVTSTLIRAMRWRLVLKPIARVPRLDVWLITVASSLINFVIPIRSGEIARSFFLRQRDSIPISKSLPTVAVDRSFDMLAMLSIGARRYEGERLEFQRVLSMPPHPQQQVSV